MDCKRVLAGVGALALFAGLVAAPTARADDFRFTNTPAGSGPFTFSWQDAGNWVLDNPMTSDHAVPNGVGDSASLIAAINGPTTLNLNGAVTLGSLLFDAGQAYTVDTGSGTGSGLTFQTSSGNAAINVTATFGFAAHEVKAGVRLNSPTAVTVSTAGSSFTLSGAVDNNGNLLTIGGEGNTLSSGGITGPGGLQKTGGGQLTLRGTNTYSGTTTVSGGTLRASTANAFSPNSAVSVASGATLDLNSLSQSIGPLSGAGAVTLGTATLSVAGGSATSTLSGKISGSGGSLRVTAGTLALSASNTYTGGTTIDGGLLQANTATGTTTASATGSSASAVSVNSGGTLAGTGVVSGAVSVNNGGTITAGDGTTTPGKLTTGAQTWANGGIYSWKINNATGTAGSSNGWDQVRMTTFNAMTAGSSFTVRAFGFSGGSAAAPANFNTNSTYTWAIAHANAGTFDTSKLVLDASDLATRTGTPSSRFSLSSSGGDLSVSYSPTPEPSSLGLIAFGALGVLRRPKRQRPQGPGGAERAPRPVAPTAA